MALKKKLVVEYNFDFSLYGMITPVKEYKLAWLINQRTGIHLIKQEDIILEFISSEKLFVSNYLYTAEHSTIRLVKNRVFMDNLVSPSYLIPELNRFDYLLLVSGTPNDYTEHELVDIIKNISDIQYISQLDIEKIKSRDNLIFS